MFITLALRYIYVPEVYSICRFPEQHLQVLCYEGKSFSTQR